MYGHITLDARGTSECALLQAIILLRPDRTIDRRFELDDSGRLKDPIEMPMLSVQRSKLEDALPAIKSAAALTARSLALLQSMSDMLDDIDAAAGFIEPDLSMSGDGDASLLGFDDSDM